MALASVLSISAHARVRSLEANNANSVCKSNCNLHTESKRNALSVTGSIQYTKNTVGAQEASRFSCSAHTQNVYIVQWHFKSREFDFLTAEA